MTHTSFTTNTTLCSPTLPLSPSSTTSSSSSSSSSTSSSSSSSSSTSSNMGCKKPRRFSLIRIFGSSNTPQPSSLSIENIPEHYRPSHHQQPSHHHLNSLQSKLLRERRNSIASMSDNNMFRSKSSFDVKASRPFLSRGSSQATTAPAPEMNEKMRQFDELLQTHRGSTIRISLTPSLLQEP